MKVRAEYDMRDGMIKEHMIALAERPVNYETRGPVYPCGLNDQFWKFDQ